MTKVLIPTISLDALELAHQDQRSASLDVFVVDQRIENLESEFLRPYRTNYYGVGICLQGSASLSADLEDCLHGAKTVLAMPPQTIKQWHQMSSDFGHIAVFFTKSYITDQNTIDLDRFGLFDGHRILKVSDTDAIAIEASLRHLQQRYRDPHPYRHEILKPLICALLFELEAMSDQQRGTAPPENRSSLLTKDFKRLLKRHAMSERQVKFYAEKLTVSPRHLSATVKYQTGRTAGEWIQEAVLLEARVLLQNARLTIAQVTDALQFPDQSSFGKFFKNLTGRSPLAYRKDFSAHPTF